MLSSSSSSVLHPGMQAPSESINEPAEGDASSERVPDGRVVVAEEFLAFLRFFLEDAADEGAVPRVDGGVESGEVK